MSEIVTLYRYGGETLSSEDVAYAGKTERVGEFVYTGGLSDGAIEFLYACTGVHTTMSDNADSEDVDAARDWLSDLLWERRNV